MRPLVDRLEPVARVESLLVLLAPAQARSDDLKVRGFVADVRDRSIQADVLLPDLTYTGFFAEKAAANLHECVIEPAQAAGYRNIWLAGISLGAYSALHYAASRACEISGIFLIAPYPGTGDVLSEITRAGGPVAWSRSASPCLNDERVWWRWLCQQSMTDCWQTRIYLGTGLEDRFFRGQSMLFRLLPKDHVQLIPGGHEWVTWQALWRYWLEEGPLSDRRHRLGWAV